MVSDGFQERAEGVLASAALQALLQLHPGRVAWEVQAGGRRKDWRMVYGLFDLKW